MRGLLVLFLVMVSFWIAVSQAASLVEPDAYHQTPVKRSSHPHVKKVISDTNSEEEEEHWLQVYNVLNNVLNCKNIPPILSLQVWCYSEPEVPENRPKGIFNIMEHRKFLCDPSNLGLIDVKERICHDFENNKEDFKESLIGLIKEMGMEKFASTPMTAIYNKIEQRTGLAVTFIKDEILQLMFKVIEDNFMKKPMKKQ